MLACSGSIMSSAEPATKRRKEEAMDKGNNDDKNNVKWNKEEASPDMFSDNSPELESEISAAQPVKQNSNLSFDGSFTDSPDIFSDFSAELEQSIMEEELKEVDDGDTGEGCAWKGVSLSELRGSTLFSQMPPIKPSKSHSVLCQVPSDSSQNSSPPQSEAWDSNHVRMPFSAQSLYPVASTGGKTNLHARWDLVKQALSKKITTSFQLEAAVLSYNSKYSCRWDFKGLHGFFSDVLEPPEVNCFFSELLPSIIQLALQLPILVDRPIPLLRQHMNHSISLSQLQIASLLANALLCTFPRRNTSKQGSEYASFPDINFNRLYATQKSTQRCSEKLKCIFHYFRRVCNKAPEGVVTFTRHYIPPNYLPQWEHSQRTFTKLHISSVGTIEDQGFGMLQMDFANKKIGGGVLGWGCVQEEIRFVICPELIITRLFTESLDTSESLLISGCERFSDYTGYANNFEWAGDHSDNTPCDSSGRRLCAVVAIDAMALRFPNIQFQPQNLRREVNKAYVGFHNSDIPAEHLAPVATGNWGCGAYRGNPRLKALLQLMAAAQAGRNLAYFTFGDKVLRDDVFSMYTFLKEHEVTVGQLWSILCAFQDHYFCTGKWTQELYPFVRHMIDPSSSPPKSKGSFSQKEEKAVKSPRKQTTTHRSPDRSSTTPSIPKRNSQSRDTSQNTSSKEFSGGSAKKETKSSNNTQHTPSKKEESLLLNESKKTGIKEQLKESKRDGNKTAFNGEPSCDSETAKKDAPANSSSHRGSLLDSLDAYDNVATSSPKRKISDYFNKVNAPK